VHDPLAGLPRVTYANAAADFTALHTRIDETLESLSGSLLGADHAHLIDGRPEHGGSRNRVASPIDASLNLGSVAWADERIVDLAVQAARRAAPGWRQTSPLQRARLLRGVAEAVRSQRLRWALASVLEVGKSRLEALGEIEESIDLIAHYCEQLESAQGWEQTLRSGPGGETGHDRLRPYGVFAVISPFNYPFALALGMCTGALLGGNCVVLKPSPGAVLSAAALAEVFTQAGLPSGVFNLVCGDAATGRILASHPRVDGVAFTGSYDVGMQLLRQAAAGPFMKPVLAELGGKNAAFVAASADVEVAASGVARSAFGLSGQKCSSCSKVYVHRSVRDAFIDSLQGEVAGLRVGDPRHADTFTGPVIDARAGLRFEQAVRTARAAGPAHLLIGGERLQGGPFDAGVYLAPTVVADLHADHELNRRELFLPLLSLQTFDELSVAIEDSNRSHLGLTAGIYAREPSELECFDDRIEAGVLYANRASGATTGAWPGFQSFCGWKGSGLTGKGGLGAHYVQQFMREQSRTVASR